MTDVQTPATHRHDPDSSYAAEQEVTASGSRAAQQHQAAEVVRQWPGHTSSQLARLSGMDRHALGKRLPECETAGTAQRGSTVRDPETGRLGVSWWPAEYPESTYRRDCYDMDQIMRTEGRNKRRRALADVGRQRGDEAMARVRRMVQEEWDGDSTDG